MSEKPASLGAEIIDGETFPYWTERVRQVRREESTEAASRPLVVIDAADVAERIDRAIAKASASIEHQALTRCLEIACDEGALNTARRIRALIEGLEDAAVPEPVAPSNPLTVKAPV